MCKPTGHYRSGFNTNGPYKSTSNPNDPYQSGFNLNGPYQSGFNPNGPYRSGFNPNGHYNRDTMDFKVLGFLSLGRGGCVSRQLQDNRVGISRFPAKNSNGFQMFGFLSRKGWVCFTPTSR